MIAVLERAVATLLLAISTLFGGYTPAPVATSTPHVAVSTTSADLVRVVDGDTIVVSIDGKKEFVRYIGIDTPEYNDDGTTECYAEAATKHNRELVTGHPLTLVSDKQNRDTYNRLLRYVYAGDTFVNADLVRGGYARAVAYYPDTAQRDLFEQLEYTARQSGVGIWGTCITD